MNFNELKKKILSKKIKLYKNNTKKFIEYQFQLYMGKKLNLDSPKTYNEKIQWFKLNCYDSTINKCSDKLLVRDYIKEKGLSSILTELYKVYNSTDEIDLNDLPNKFVLKTTHSSGGVYVVKDKEHIDKIKMKKILEESLKNDLSITLKEWQYKDLIPRIIAEELIETDKKYLLDYKIFCFKGEPKYIYVAEDTTGGESDYCIDFYDTEWNHLDVKRVGHRNRGPIEKPPMLDEMLNIARLLSKDFEHVRVDLYNENGKIYFGELTFTTASGYGKFENEEFDIELGNHIDINNFPLKKEGRNLKHE